MERNLGKTQREMLALERFLPHHIREQAERILFASSILFLSFTVLCNLLINTRFGMLWPIAQGFFLLTFALLLVTILIEIYFNSLRLRLETHHEISFATLLVIGLHHPRKKDLAKAFLHSHLGREVVSRLGISREMIKKFINTKKDVQTFVPTKGFFHELAGQLHDEDPYLRDFLSRVHVDKNLLMATSEAVEKKHHRKLASRPFLRNIFPSDESSVLSIDHMTRLEIEELEHFYHIIITELATQQIINHFKEDLLLYVSDGARIAFITDLVESTLADHKERFHGASVILPADVRNFLIHKKAYGL